MGALSFTTDGTDIHYSCTISQGTGRRE
jgi:hypothetical protein